jgi:hypothetical protein
MRVRLTTVAVEKQYYISARARVCVCVCARALNHAACKAHVPHYIVICDPSDYHIFPHYLIGTIFFGGGGGGY